MVRTVFILLVVASVLLPLSARGEDATRTTAYDVAALFQAAREPSREALGLPPRSSHLLWAAPGEDTEDDEDEPVLFIEPDLLVELVLSAAAGIFETADDASVEMVANRLIVTGPPALHAAAQEVLGLLWREASRRLALTGTHVRLDAAGRAKLLGTAESLAEALRSGRLSRAEHDALLALGSSSAASAQVASGTRAVIGRIDSTAYVRDYDVEIAQDSCVGDPMLDTVNEGWLLDVRPYVLQGDGVFVEVLGQAAALERPIRRIPLEVDPFGAVEMPACSVWRFATAARLRAGETLAFSATTADEGLEVFLLHAEARGARVRPSGIRRYDVGALTAMPFPWRLVPDPDPRPDTGALLPPSFRRLAESEPRLEGDVLIDELSLQFGEDAWQRENTWLLASEGAVLASNDQPLLDAIGEVLRVREEVLRTHRLTLRLVRVQGHSERVLTEASLDVPGNRPVAWQAGREQAYLADWDVEVAQEARAGDPQPSTVFGGLALNLELSPAPMAGAAVLAVDAAWTEVDATLEPKQNENECTGVVEIPRLSRQLVTQDLVVHAGDPTRVPVSRLADGADLVLEVVLAP